jgi:hypothetical protein
MICAGALQPTWDVPTDWTFQSAPIRCSTTVAPSSWTPGFGTICAAAQIGDDAAIRHRCTVYRPAFWSSPPELLPWIAATIVVVWFPQVPMGATVEVVAPPPEVSVEVLGPPVVVVVVVLDEDVVVERCGFLAALEPPLSHAVKVTPSTVAQRTARSGRRATSTSGFGPQHGAPGLASR